MSDNKNLKPGWKVWRFDQMATNVNVRIDNPSESGMEHYVGLEHLDSDSLKIRRWGTPDDVEATKLMFKKGDIIFGRRRAYQRKLGVAEFDGICSAHAMVLRAKPEVVLPEFLPFFMQSDLFMNRAVEISVGSLSPTINWKTMAVQEFALPPLDEQQRLVAILREMDAVAEAQQAALNTSALLLAATVTDVMKPRDGFVKRTLGDVADYINGYAFKPGEWSEDGIPIIRIQNLNGSSEFNYYSGDTSNRWFVEDGDLLFAWSGNRGTSFGPFVWTRGRGLLNQHIFRVIPKPGIERAFLFVALLGLTKEVEKKAHGSAGLVHITKSALTKLPIWIPSVDTQRQIAEQFDIVRVTREAIQDRLCATAGLKKAVISTSFEGG